VSGDVDIPPVAEQLKGLLAENARLRADDQQAREELVRVLEETQRLEAKLDALQALLTSDQIVSDMTNALIRSSGKQIWPGDVRAALTDAVDAVLSLPVPGDPEREAER
jgi:chromosome segregation ATPase